MAEQIALFEQLNRTSSEDNSDSVHKTRFGKQKD